MAKIIIAVVGIVIVIAMAIAGAYVLTNDVVCGQVTLVKLAPVVEVTIAGVPYTATARMANILTIYLQDHRPACVRVSSQHPQSKFHTILGLCDGEFGPCTDPEGF